MNVVDEYLAKITEPQKTVLLKVTGIVKAIAPNAVAVITYGMPGFEYNGKYLVSFGVFKDHMSIFPGSGSLEKYKASLAGFKTSKGTIQFTAEKPLPTNIIENIVKYRISEIDQ